MAEIIAGSQKGEEVIIHDFCNGWFQLEDGKIVSADKIKLTPAEMRRVTRAHANGQAGKLFEWFTLKLDGTFKKLPRKPRNVG